MQNHTKSWTALLTLCLLLTCCGSEEPAPEPSAAAERVQQGPLEAELVVEASEPKLIVDGESIDAMQIVESILSESEEGVLLLFHTQIDRDFKREGQCMIWITPNPPITPDQAGVDKAADEIFGLLKAEFDARAKQAQQDALAFYQAQAKTKADEVRRLQQALQVFQESRRGLPQTDASRLERRTLDRQVEVALQEQIEAGEKIEELQKRIARDRHATLLRVR